ncbi:MAG: LysR substrate-binding domain-containing protein, partial [Alphaproteobacteria bacterium]|nr:LysR substrate-binding domain-containing protein [Alphaproteobacteria bacterium]
VRVSGNLRTNNTEAVHAAALGGLGIALLPSWLVGQEVQSGRLAAVLSGYRAAPGAFDTGIHALYPANRHLSTKVRAFVDFLVERYGPSPYWEDPLQGEAMFAAAPGAVQSSRPPTVLAARSRTTARSASSRASSPPAAT